MTGRGYILGYPLKLLCLCTELKGSNFNIRILYAFLPDGAPILLVGFGERSGKRVSSYESYIPVAKERLNHILEA